MPIYPYACTRCGHQADILQKVSDQPLSHCPACGALDFHKQISAPNFALKGNGWYATDFKGSSTGSNTSASTQEASAKDANSTAAASGKTESGPPATHACSGQCSH